MNTLTVRLNETVPDELLKIAVIAARSQGQWVFSRHRERTTLEFPGGHREEGESGEILGDALPGGNPAFWAPSGIRNG